MLAYAGEEIDVDSLQHGDGWQKRYRRPFVIESDDSDAGVRVIDGLFASPMEPLPLLRLFDILRMGGEKIRFALNYWKWSKVRGIIATRWLL